MPDQLSRTSQVPVVLGINDAYVYPLIISVLSAQSHTQNQINFIIAFDRNLLSTESQKIIQDVPNFKEIHFRFLEIDISSSRWDGIFINSSHFGRMAYIKLLLPEYLLINFVWLDADTLVRGPLDDLLCSPFFDSGNIISAVPEYFPGHRWNINKAIRKSGKHYFNAGVMLLNSTRWQENGVNVKWRKVISSYEKFSFGLADQDVLNFIFATQDGFVPLPEKYNFGSDLELTELDTRILHFKGVSKPWHYDFSTLVQRGGNLKEYADFEKTVLLELKIEKDLHKKVEFLRTTLISRNEFTQEKPPNFRIKVKHKIKMALLLIKQLAKEREI